jgi:hypothetical protein
MISFTQFLAESKEGDGTYASVTFTSGSTKQLRDIQKQYGIPNPLQRNKFHSTLIYSRNVLKDVDSKDLRLPLDTKSFVMEEWDQRNGKTCLVLKYESEWMKERHDFYRSIGGTHDFDSYTPHITLSYDLEDKAGQFNGKTVELNLTLAREVVEPLNTEWSK